MSKEILYEKLGRAIRSRREALKMTQSDLAKYLELSRASITNIELGKQSVLVDQLFRFAEALKTEPSNLLPSGSLEPQPSKTEALSPELANWIERARKS